MINKNNRPNITIANGIHNGENTHHQDQAITLHSLSTINAIVKSVGKLPI